MNELQITAQLSGGAIITNIDDLKAQLEERLKEFDTAVFTEESKAILRSELASLRKLVTSINDRKKSVKVEILKPYESFEKEIKDLVSIIEKRINALDKQLTEIEEERIRKRKKEIDVLYLKLIPEDIREILPLQKIYDQRWNNASTKIKKIREDLQAMADKVVQDIQIINNSMSDAKVDALEKYKASCDLGAALSLINNYEENKRRVLALEEEKRRKEEERQREAEIQRAVKAERRHVEEMEDLHRERLTAAEAMSGQSPDEIEELPFVQPNTITVFYRVVATPEELEKVEMAFNSIGIYFERKE